MVVTLKAPVTRFGTEGVGGSNPLAATNFHKKQPVTTTGYFFARKLMPSLGGSG